MKRKQNEKSERATIRAVFNQSEAVHDYLEEYDNRLLLTAQPIDMNDFVNSYMQLDVINGTMSLSYIEGFIVFMQMTFVDEETGEFIVVNPGTIIMNRDFSDDKIKHRYLLAHEVAHWIIKRDSLIDDLSYYACSKSISKRINIINTTSMMNYMNNYPGAYSEMLADGIANSLLMPAETFVPLAKKFMKELGFTDSKVFFGERLKETDELVCKLASQYLVPEFAVKNHLFALGLYDVR
ncbi:MAG: hypothetical protein IJ696_00060 [Ruminococcus sp.]|nr:hypothetical protein [Ruminococcus sp.]